MSLTLFLVLNGERIDLFDPSWRFESATAAAYDPPLTLKGEQQAEKTGSYINTFLQEYVPDDMKMDIEYIITTSPFLCTSQTAIGIAKGIFKSIPNSKPILRIDSSLAEWHSSIKFSKEVPSNIVDARFKEIEDGRHISTI